MGRRKKVVLEAVGEPEVTKADETNEIKSAMKPEATKSVGKVEAKEPFWNNDDLLFRKICEMVSGDPDKMPNDSGMQREIVHRYEGAKWMRERIGE
jgi:hypothetical protein